jgi:hypothetical protein
MRGIGIPHPFLSDMKHLYEQSEWMWSILKEHEDIYAHSVMWLYAV